MATKAVSHLADCMVDKATQLGWSTTQCKGVTYQQVVNNLPVQYQEDVSETFFAKAKHLFVRRIYVLKLAELKQNTTLRQEILAIFPDATFAVTGSRIIIDMDGRI